MLVFDKCGKPDLRSFPVFSADVSAQPALSRYNHPAFTILPGFCDVHVHFREPGFSYKETIATGSRAAAAGGYTAVCTMPNLDPVPDDPAHLKAQTDIIRKDAVVGAEKREKSWRRWRRWQRTSSLSPTTGKACSPGN